VSVAKAGIICTLNARTAILAAANPVHSKYDPKLSVVENIKLPPTLLSRFDMIYLILDKQNEASDRRLANHIVSLYSTLDGKVPNEAVNNEMRTNLIATKALGVDKNFLAKYISYARKFHNPTIPDGLVMTLVQEYKKMRAMGNTKKTITATPRQLDSMIRISEAIAKMRLATEVTEADVTEAVRLIKTAMKQSATDPRTGEIDMGIITTGVSATSSERVRKICEFIKTVQNDFKDKVNLHGVKYHNLFDFLQSKVKEGALTGERNGGESETVVTEREFRDALMILEEDGIINQIGHKNAPTIRFVAQGE
jgi:DNA replication licensing factor MCM4